MTASDHSTDSPIQLQLALLLEEAWRDVPGYEGCYEVSNFGVVRTKVTRVRGYVAGTVLKQSSVEGYVSVTLLRNGKSKRIYVHQLVMLAFVGEPPAGQEVNHEDGDKANNRLDNLTYMTRKNNLIHARDVLHAPFAQNGEKNGRARLTADQVREIRRRLDKGERKKDLAVEFNVNPTTIFMIHKRINWKHIA